MTRQLVALCGSFPSLNIMVTKTFHAEGEMTSLEADGEEPSKVQEPIDQCMVPTLSSLCALFFLLFHVQFYFLSGGAHWPYMVQMCARGLNLTKVSTV